MSTRMKRTHRGPETSSLFEIALRPYFRERLPAGVGNELALAVRSRLQKAGYSSGEYVDDILSDALLSMVLFLARHGSDVVTKPKVWALGIAHVATSDFLKKELNSERLSLDAFILDQITPAEAEPLDIKAIEELARAAILTLPARDQEFLFLDLVSGRSSAEIRDQLKIPSVTAYRRRKLQAYSQLRNALKKLIFSDRNTTA